MSKRILAMTLAVLMLFALLSGCAQKSSEEPQPEQPAQTETPAPPAEPEGLKEAPMLAEKVAAGTLPKVEDRMPKEEDILVSDTYESTGVYGGDFNYTWMGVDDKWRTGQLTEEPLFRFLPDGSGLEPNVAKSYEVNENATEYIIHFREGMKWSDGEDFNTDDVIFYWEHMLLKETFGKQLYDCYYSTDPATGERAVCTVEKIDDYTVKVTHKYPSPLFLERLAIDNKWFYMPEHFMKTILPEFIGDEKALEEAQKRGFNDAESLNKQYGYYYWLYPEIPTLNAWVATNDANSPQHVMERNPYYWKTDTEGNQLPYIDRIVCTKVEDKSHKLLNTLAGDTTLQDLAFSDFTVLKEGEAAGNYTVYRWSTPTWCNTDLELNQTCKDEKLRELFQDIRFREAISVAANRAEIAEIVYDGLADPQNAAVPEGLQGYVEGAKDQWAEYDVVRANQLLDEIGLKYDAKNEYRTHKDGSELTLTIHYNNGLTDAPALSELLTKYFEAVGLRTVVKPVDNTYFTDMKYNNELEVCLESSPGIINVALRPDVLVPLRVITPWFGMYGLYNATGGAEGVKPEGDVAEIMNLWTKLSASTSTEEINKYGDEIIKLHNKNHWMIGFVSGTPQLLAVSNTMKNVPENYIYCDEFRSWGNGKPFQFYIEQ